MKSRTGTTKTSGSLSIRRPRFSTRELDRETWKDFALLAPKQGYCWCTYYQREKPLRVPGASREEIHRINRKFKESLIKEGRSHALLVYDGDRAVGWCQYGLKQELPRIDAGRNYRKLDQLPQDERLWRITCFFVDREYRRMGVSKLALEGALESIQKQGGGTVEAYPVVSEKMATVPEWRWFGTPRMFERLKFKRVAPLGTSLLLMRRTIRGS